MKNNKKDCFIQEIDLLLKNGKIKLSEEAFDFFQDLIKVSDENDKPTEKGLKIIQCLQEETKKYNNSSLSIKQDCRFNARQIGELLFLSSRSVSGTMNKLFKDGYVEKVIEDKKNSPVYYKLTEKGKKYKVN
ncbi:MAG: hypothetical protein MSA65_03430 [Mollicutes bacterium]|nr:hypothetical protein [Mollicutes bacterium]